MNRIARKFDYSYYDDFLTGGIATNKIGKLGLAKSGMSGGSADVVGIPTVAVENHPGTIELTSEWVDDYGLAMIHIPLAAKLLLKDFKRFACTIQLPADWDLDINGLGIGFVNSAQHQVSWWTGYGFSGWHTANENGSANYRSASKALDNDFHTLEIELDHEAGCAWFFFDGECVFHATDDLIWDEEVEMTVYIDQSAETPTPVVVIDELAFSTVDYLSAKRDVDFGESVTHRLTHPGQANTTRVTNLG